jgi:uncharacterized protein
MSAIKQAINTAVKEAMRAKEKERLGVLRLINAEFKRIEVDERIELDDGRVLAILDKMLKQRRDSISQFAAAGRTDLVDAETFEVSIIQTFLPQALTAAEITALIEAAVAQTGASSAADMGKVMAIIKPQAQGRADMGDVSKLIKARLS